MACRFCPYIDPVRRQRWVAFAAIEGALAVAIGVAVYMPSVVQAQPDLDATATSWNPVAGMPLTEPVQRYSRNGVLRVDLTAHPKVLDVSGSPLVARPFNDSLFGPTLHVRPGDKLVVKFRNDTDQHTNIHYHGIHMSPNGRADNVFRDFKAGGTYKSVVRMPRDHAIGTFWYHTHYHGNANSQVQGGLTGLLIVDGFDRLVASHTPASGRPAVRGDIAMPAMPKERQIILRDVVTKSGTNVIAFDKGGGESALRRRLVNGLLEPTFDLASGQTQLWRIANVGANIWYKLRLPGHRFHVVAEDGVPVWKVWKARTLYVPPGKRFDVLVQGGKPGDYTLRTAHFDGGVSFTGSGTPAYDGAAANLAHVTVTGPPRPPGPLPKRMASQAREQREDLANQPIAKKRRFSFSLSLNAEQGFRAMINGKVYDPAEKPVTPVLGTVEEWTLVNNSTEMHPFHIHVNDFQVMSVNGKPFHAKGRQDIVDIPPSGTVVIRQKFEHFTGKFVFHCHVLFHEDYGMMRAVDVVAPGEAPSAQPGPAPAMHGHSHAKSATVNW